MRAGAGWCPGSIARVKTSASLDSDQESETDSGSRLVVAVDGPSGAGKSSTSRGVAIALGLRYLDTGAMYRALTWWLLERGVDTTDSEVVAVLATGPVIEVSTDPRAPWTRVDGTDVSEAIRTREVTAAVSAVAAVPQVRAHLIAMQRQIIASAPGIVAEGRDIGTVVAPDAQVKVFLTADGAARASRRAAEANWSTRADQDRRDRLDAAQSGKAADAVEIDSTGLGLDEVVGIIVGLVPNSCRRAGNDAERGCPRTRCRRRRPAQRGQVDAGEPDPGQQAGGRRGHPGVTRDRVAYDAIWNGRAFTLVDTGGWEPSVEGTESLAARVAAQARVAVDAADAVLFVVDATVGVTDADAAVANVLRRSGKPVVVAANKVDDTRAESEVAALWSLGLGEPAPVSALHGRGSGDLLDLVLDALPDAPKETDAEAGPRRVALLGRPNVGKSSLLNKLVGHERALVDPVAGTTRDPVDELVELGGTTWRFVDTAGIRRRFRENQGADYYAALRTAGALDLAEVAVVLIDASEPLTEQDLRIVSMVIEAGRALVIAFNKWDLVDEERQRYLEREIDRQLHTARWAPRVNISAATGRHMERLVPALETALEGWETRVSTGRLNAWLTGLVAATPPPVRGGRQPKILFATQAGVRPPHFVLFSSGFLEAAYRRFIERRLREEFGFDGSPVQVSVRVRAKRERTGRRPAARSGHRR